MDRIRALVETKLQASLPGAIVDAAFRHHTRRGIRHGCYCEWCDRKRRANREFYIDVMHRQGAIRFPPIPRPYCGYDSWDEIKWAAVHAARQQLRANLRSELYQIYKRPEYDPAF